MTVQIWLASLDDMDFVPTGSLSPAERERAERIGSPLPRRRFLARRWMARVLLARATGQAPDELVLERRCDRCGKPHPASPISTDSTKVWWSVSSSAGLASVAISSWRVGLDIERDDGHPRWERIAHRFYTDAERRAVGESRTRFLEFWTMKEAFLKALGLGLVGGLRSLDCANLSEARGSWHASPTHPGWRFAHLQPLPGFVAALAVEGAPDSIELRRWTLTPRGHDEP